MSKTDEARAALAEAELEERFLEAKTAHEAGNLSDEEYRAIKQDFHAARVAAREQREAEAARIREEGGEPVAPGDAVATPETVRATARTTDIGGGAQ